MLRRLAALCAALILLVAVVPSARAGDVGQTCSPFGIGYYTLVLKWRAEDEGVGAFNGVRGEAIIRTLYVCGTIGNIHGGSFVLPANLEAGDGTLMQLGYGYTSNTAAADFYYAYDTGTATPWPGAMKPENGKRYRFTIRKSGTDAIYTITRVSDGYYENMTKPWPWSNGFTLVWWGFEAWNTVDYLGVYNGVHNSLRALQFQTQGGQGIWLGRDQTDYYMVPLSRNENNHRKCGHRTSDGTFDIFYVNTMPYGEPC